MTRWAAFAGVTIAVLVLLLVLAQLSQRAVEDATVPPHRSGRWRTQLADGADHLDVATPSPEATLEQPTRTPQLSTLALLVNVAVSHGLFGAILLAGIWLTDVPASALGVTADPLSTGWLAVAVGLGLGGMLAAANAVGSGLARVFDVDPSAELRALLAPESPAGWLVLLGVVLPIIAGFEELLFRAALVGAFSVGFDVSPWLLAVLSSAAFAAGHGAQGSLGIVATGTLGLLLAVAFILTGSLLAVVIAHYVVNATEFIVHEALEWEPFPATG